MLLKINYSQFPYAKQTTTKNIMLKNLRKKLLCTFLGTNRDVYFEMKGRLEVLIN